MEHRIRDKWRKMQKDTPPQIEKSLIGYEIEILLSGWNDEGEPFNITTNP